MRMHVRPIATFFQHRRKVYDRLPSPRRGWHARAVAMLLLPDRHCNGRIFGRDPLAGFACRVGMK